MSPVALAMMTMLLTVVMLPGCGRVGAIATWPGDGREVTEEPGKLLGPSSLRLPFVVVGQTPTARLTLEATGLVGPLEIRVTGPFAVTGSRDVIADGEIRELTVTCTDPGPACAVGWLSIAGGGHMLSVDLSAVVGAPNLPAGLTWQDDGDGSYTVAAMPSAPFPTAEGPWTDPSVWIWVPHGITSEAGVVAHLHGHRAVLADILEIQDLPALFAASRRDAVFFVPQGPVDAASGDFGKLMAPGGYADLVRDVIAVLYRDGLLQRPVDGPQVITAHSGGFRAAARILEHGGLDVAALHLFDSLYGEADVFEEFVVQGGILRSSYTDGGGTMEQNRDLAARLAGRGEGVGTTFTDAELASHQVSIGYSPASHVTLISHEESYADWLRYSGLPALP